MPRIEIETSLCILAATIAFVMPAVAQQVQSKKGDSAIETPSANETRSAEAPPGRILTDLNQLPDAVLRSIGLTREEVLQGTEAAGTAGHPFTTQMAIAAGGDSMLALYPFNATGKLLMKKGAQNLVCTASVIGKSLLATAAHCVHFYGEENAGFMDAVFFQPARHHDSLPFQTWEAEEWFIPEVYWNGTDTCSPEADGIVCENDVAVVVLKERSGKFVSDFTGKYLYPRAADLPDPEEGTFGFFKFQQLEATQITQLGYPSANFSGVEMMRTDSLGYTNVPNNIIIGSNQTGGSSGGPWLMNFGMSANFTGTMPFFNQPNTLLGVTSWGYTDDQIKLQGASRFSTNKTYTDKTNIEALVDQACARHPWAC